MSDMILLCTKVLMTDIYLCLTVYSNRCPYLQGMACPHQWLLYCSVAAAVTCACDTSTSYIQLRLSNLNTWLRVSHQQWWIQRRAGDERTQPPPAYSNTAVTSLLNLHTDYMGIRFANCRNQKKYFYSKCIGAFGNLAQPRPTGRIYSTPRTLAGFKGGRGQRRNKRAGRDRRDHSPVHHQFLDPSMLTSTCTQYYTVSKNVHLLFFE